MSKLWKIYTKTGDKGTTGLVGGSRIRKTDVRLEAYGTVDELNATLGVIRSFDLSEDDRELLISIQHKLFNIGSRLASDKKGDAMTSGLSITEDNIQMLEIAIDRMEEDLPELNHFILPGGEPASAYGHVARTVCRRAERRILELAEHYPVESEILIFMNRLSDLLFVFSRKLAADNGSGETPWRQL